MSEMNYRRLGTSGLVVSLSASPPGQPTMMTLTETNAGGQDASVAIGCGVSDFWVTQGGAEVWRRSKDGPQPLCPISLGGVLHPRESRTFTATWDGHFNEASPPNPAGPFVFHGQVDGLTADAPTQTPLAVSLTTDRTAYQVGQPILMTLTETNTSDGDITVEFGPSIDLEWNQVGISGEPHCTYRRSTDSKSSQRRGQP